MAKLQTTVKYGEKVICFSCGDKITAAYEYETIRTLKCNACGETTEVTVTDVPKTKKKTGRQILKI
jgi:predicted RNA-binding Zn-ribbon protein involved in translation (DUF1610 family)